MNLQCYDQAMICMGKQCGFKSETKRRTYLCKKCRIDEKIKLLNQNGYKNLDGPMKHFKAASFNAEDGTFDFSKSFFEIVQMEDNER